MPGPNKDQFGLLKYFESEGIQVKGVLVNDYATKYSHWNAVESLGNWCARYGVPAITGVDTRAIVHILRDNGSTMGEIRIGNAASSPVWEDPNVRNLVAEVSVKDKVVFNAGGDVKIALIGKSVVCIQTACPGTEQLEINGRLWREAKHYSMPGKARR